MRRFDIGSLKNQDLPRPIKTAKLKKGSLMRKPDQILDLKGLPAAIALLKVSQVFGDMKVNNILEILGNDPEIRTDIFRVVPSSCHKKMGIKDDRSGYRIQIKKTGEL